MDRKHPPSMDLYWDDLIAGTHHMSAAAFGTYIRLLGEQWSSNCSANAQQMLSKRVIARFTKSLSEEDRADVMEKFETENGELFFNYRLCCEYEKKQKIREKRAEAGRSRGAKTNAQQMLSKCSANGKKGIGKETNVSSGENPSAPPKKSNPKIPSSARATSEEIEIVISATDPNDIELQTIIFDWLEYKIERRERYKPRGLQSLCSQMVTYAADYGIDSLRQRTATAMSNNYQGWNLGGGGKPKQESPI